MRVYKSILYDHYRPNQVNSRQQPFRLDHTIPAGVNFPGFLEKNHYRDPLVKEKFDNYTDMTGGTDFFATCAKDPERLGSSFIGMMVRLLRGSNTWKQAETLIS
jgi:hypothetical protein